MVFESCARRAVGQVPFPIPRVSALLAWAYWGGVCSFLGWMTWIWAQWGWSSCLHPLWAMPCQSQEVTWVWLPLPLTAPSLPQVSGSHCTQTLCSVSSECVSGYNRETSERPLPRVLCSCTILMGVAFFSLGVLSFIQSWNWLGFLSRASHTHLIDTDIMSLINRWGLG